MLKLNEKIYESEKGSFVFYEAEYNNDPCYAICHIDGLTLIMDKEKRIINEIIKSISKDECSLCLEKKKSKPVFKFTGNGGGNMRKRSLRLFLFARYNKMQIKNISKRRIEMHDESLLSEKILDFRSSNLYLAGASRSEKDKTRTCIIDDPINTGRKLIVIKSELHDNYLDYSEELFEMLTSSNLCYPAVSKTGRLCVIVHFEKAKAGYKIVYLSRFAYIFYTRFSSYKNMKGGVARFIHDFPKLDAELGNAEVAHVNSITWLNLRSNLMKMSSKTNGSLKDYTRDFFASYKVYTAVNNQEEILIEYRRPMINTGDYLSPMEYVTYHKCKTAEDFFHWIIFTSMRVKQLKAQTEGFAVNADGAYGVSTQAGIRANNTDKIKFSPTIEDYLHHAGKLLSMDDDCFHEEKIALQTEKTKAGTVYNFSEKELEKNMWLLLPATVKVTKFGNEQ